VDPWIEVRDKSTAHIEAQLDSGELPANVLQQSVAWSSAVARYTRHVGFRLARSSFGCTSIKRLNRGYRSMTKLRVHNFTISLDGYGAGPDQSLDNPLGIGAEALHEWFVATRTFRKLHGSEGGATGVDDDFAARSNVNVGAWIMGRNMFGALRGEWPDETWKGWWGDNPPFHAPVFVLTHHARPSIVMEGGTSYHFVTDGIQSALTRASQAANGRDVVVGGGVSTIRQYLQARLIDEMHIGIAPVLLGSGEHLFAGIDVPGLGYRLSEYVPTKAATHLVLVKR
jgi:dihydrofolate reductase